MSYDAIFKKNWIVIVINIIQRVRTIKAQDILIPDCRRQKAELTINYKKNTAMMDCPHAGYIITRQSIIAISFFAFMGYSVSLRL